jgi:plasmid stabilization system protein ParE
VKIVVLREAARELDDAIEYYEERESGLGRRLRDEVDRFVRWVVQHPEVPRVRAGGYRRVNLKVFPYYIAYVVRGDTLWVLAIASAYRRPEYWIGRR